jgi:23S rRNA (uridine2552-2'-O)-methyltransferase
VGFKVQDHYFKKAKKDNFVARSIYKLEEIDKKYKVLNAGDSVVDLGYHPGSWVQYTAQKIGESGDLVGIDIKPLSKQLCHLKNVRLYEMDVYDVEKTEDLGVESKFDVVLSDMAPNTTGIKSVDQDRSLGLVEMVFSLYPVFLKEGGNSVVKVFDSNAAQQFLKENRKLFKTFHLLKPKSTRSVSKEFFVIGIGYKG